MSRIEIEIEKKEDEGKDKKRKHKRKDVTMVVQLDDIFGLVENVSCSGMRMIPDEFPERITDVYISFKNKKNELFEISGNIVWYEKIGEGRYKIGVEFNQPVDQLAE